jgi:hypothetical protein
MQYREWSRKGHPEIRDREPERAYELDRGHCGQRFREHKRRARENETVPTGIAPQLNRHNIIVRKD